jgi:hypothetical protein
MDPASPAGARAVSESSLTLFSSTVDVVTANAPVPSSSIPPPDAKALVYACSSIEPDEIDDDVTDAGPSS